MSNVAVNWFEIPVSDLARAVEFYGVVLGAPLGTMDGPDGEMHVFLGSEGPAGALSTSDSSPGQSGTIVYLNCTDIDAALRRVSGAGGSVVQERTSIGPFGFVGQFIDSEGNKVALHTSAE